MQQVVEQVVKNRKHVNKLYTLHKIGYSYTLVNTHNNERKIL